MNYMKEVAQMLGVELEEEFYIKGCEDLRFRITEEDIGYFYKGEWIPMTCALCDLLNGKLELIKIPKPILTDEEKEYLSYVIRPFRDRVKYIYKSTCANGDYEAIAVVMENYGYCDWLNFPKFRKGTMYKGMELIKEYSLEDLGL